MSIKEEKIVEKAQEFLAKNYGPFPVVISKAKGVWVWDVNGKKYIDMLSIWSAVNQGHRHPKIVKALVNQAKKVTLTSRAFYNEVLGEFAEKLAKVSGMEMVLPMNSGAEAVETAIKTSRKWGYKVKKVEENNAEIIACKNNFHGRTTTITGFSTDEKNRDGFGPFTPGFKTILFNDSQALQEAITKNTVAFLVEPIQIEGGINFPSENYFKEVRKICDENNVLLVLDEIQTGFGRTGKLFAHEHYGIKPDVMTLGKALGGGVFPVSAVVSSKEVLGVFNPGEHGSTFAGNPLACAVGMTAIDVIVKEKLAQNAEKVGKYFLAKLKTLNSEYILELRGKGLLIGVDIDHNKGHAHDLCFELAKNSVLTKDVTNKRLDSVLRFTPPLIINEKEIDWSFERISKVFSS